MGNRAVVIFQNKNEFSPAVYLHWNGGPESIYAFLNEFDRRDYGHSPCYDCARFAQIVGDFFDSDHFSGLSLGIETAPNSLKDLQSLVGMATDNGVFLVSGYNGKRKIRRFIWNWDSEKAIELKQSEVYLERKRAMKHKYNSNPDSIAKTFLKMSKNKTNSHKYYKRLSRKKSN